MSDVPGAPGLAVPSGRPAGCFRAGSSAGLEQAAAEPFSTYTAHPREWFRARRRRTQGDRVTVGVTVGVAVGSGMGVPSGVGVASAARMVSIAATVGSTPSSSAPATRLE